MSILKKPGASLLLIGLLLLFIVRPIAGVLPLVGGILATISFVVGALGIVGGGYLMVRSVRGPAELN